MEKYESIKDMNLSVNTYNALNRAKIRSVEQITSMTRRDLFRVRNLGKSGVDEIEAKLAENGLRLSK